MVRGLKFGVVAIAAAAGSVQASTAHYAADMSATSSLLHGGNRELLSMGFVGTSDVFTGANFLTFKDGELVSPDGTFGWNDAIPRDMGGGNTHEANPDRADSASPFAGEGMSTGTLAEVFGPFGTGYKNMSWIIDGEGAHVWSVDLRFGAGESITIDGDSSSVEVAILERGRNSDIDVYGVYADGSYTANAVTMLHGDTGNMGWNLNTLEIGDNQPVVGVGLSLDEQWGTIVGVRLVARTSQGGPDIVAVGTVFPVPTPGTLALAGFGGLVSLRRKR
ncbi:MAG: exosortase-dependent surface protein XDP2 [Phycisphaerales bacterium]|jgi:hypothetical protein|nr:exosortase-dependent surface protein XDP2 [Phycisphaerales bacterium]